MSTPEYWWSLPIVFLWCHCPKSLFCALVSNPGEGRTARSLSTGIPAPGMSRWSQALLACWSPWTRSGWLRGPPEWEGSFCVGRACSSWIPSRHLCCHLLLGPWQVVRPPECSAAWLCEWLCHAGLARKGLRHPAGAAFPVFNIRFDLPLAIVSKDQGMSITF